MRRARGQSTRPVTDAITAGLQRVSSSRFATRQLALVRIGVAGTWLLFLLREWPHRDAMWGPDAAWSAELGNRMMRADGAFSMLSVSSSRVWFELVYGFTIIAAVAMVLGWRTRVTGVLFAAGVVSLHNRSLLIADSGDLVIDLMAIYLLFSRCSHAWSIDAVRSSRERTGTNSGWDRVIGPVLWFGTGGLLTLASVLDRSGARIEILFWSLWAVQAVWWTANHRHPGSQFRIFLDALSKVVHNAAVVLIMAQVCLIYSTSGSYKIQGSRWRDGTAVYFPLKTNDFRPWPAISDWLAGHGTVVLALTYATVLMQVAFPFVLLNRHVWKPFLAGIGVEHLGIAFFLGIPFFSLAMLSADAIFAPPQALDWLEAAARRVRRRIGAGQVSPAQELTRTHQPGSPTRPVSSR